MSALDKSITCRWESFFVFVSPCASLEFLLLLWDTQQELNSFLALVFATEPPMQSLCLNHLAVKNWWNEKAPYLGTPAMTAPTANEFLHWQIHSDFMVKKKKKQASSSHSMTRNLGCSLYFWLSILLSFMLILQTDKL